MPAVNAELNQQDEINEGISHQLTAPPMVEPGYWHNVKELRYWRALIQRTFL